jgi:hypothetical protein
MGYVHCVEHAIYCEKITHTGGGNTMITNSHSVKNAECDSKNNKVLKTARRMHSQRVVLVPVKEQKYFFGDTSSKKVCVYARINCVGDTTLDFLHN